MIAEDKSSEQRRGNEESGNKNGNTFEINESSAKEGESPNADRNENGDSFEINESNAND